MKKKRKTDSEEDERVMFINKMRINKRCRKIKGEEVERKKKVKREFKVRRLTKRTEGGEKKRITKILTLKEDKIL